MARKNHYEKQRYIANSSKEYEMKKPTPDLNKIKKYSDEIALHDKNIKEIKDKYNIKEDIPSAAKEKVAKGEMPLTKYAKLLSKATELRKKAAEQTAKNLGVTKYEALKRPTKSDIGHEKEQIRRSTNN